MLRCNHFSENLCFHDNNNKIDILGSIVSLYVTCNLNFIKVYKVQQYTPTWYRRLFTIHKKIILFRWQEEVIKKRENCEYANRSYSRIYATIEIIPLQLSGSSNNNRKRARAGQQTFVKASQLLAVENERNEGFTQYQPQGINCCIISSLKNYLIKSNDLVLCKVA